MHKQIVLKHRKHMAQENINLHEIGKTLVGTMLTANGFQVTGIGIDKPASEFIAAVKEPNATLIGAWALLTTTIPEQSPPRTKIGVPNLFGPASTS